jgi:hypothetical protein
MSKNWVRLFAGLVVRSKFFTTFPNTQSDDVDENADMKKRGFRSWFATRSGPDWTRTSDPALIKRML